MLERLLERISLSGYKEKCILKGGTFIAAVVLDENIFSSNLLLNTDKDKKMPA